MLFFEHAGAVETIKHALIVMGITFATLIALFLLVKTFTYVINFFTGKQLRRNDETPDQPNFAEALNVCERNNDTLILKNVDEKTAAMIIAIVADETGVPLENLIFRSIKLVSEGF